MRILALGAHPDDIEILCGGTLARYRQAGHDVVMAHVCNGDCGHFVIPPAELAAIRAGEAAAAAAVIGAERLTIPKVGDLEPVPTDRRLRQQVVELIREARPDLIITHSPDDYMPDHVAVSELVFFASFTASLPNWQTGGSHPAHTGVPPVYYMDTLAGTSFLPEEYVDISDTFATKVRMLECHQSQVRWLREHDNIDIVDFITVMARSRGLQCGAQYAEGFRLLRVWPRIPTRRLLP